MNDKNLMEITQHINKVIYRKLINLKLDIKVFGNLVK